MSAVLTVFLSLKDCINLLRWLGIECQICDADTGFAVEDACHGVYLTLKAKTSYSAQNPVSINPLTPLGRWETESSAY